ncbi:MAG: FAD-binding protein [Lachnospiraceae bacterium]|nr:FAD-binding protein [Lachnospiraceae bacterium]
MIENKSDVIVIGGGLAGCVAADTAAKAGKKVTMLFQTGGSTEVSGGALDVCGVIPGEKPAVVENYADGIAELVKAYPAHVYGKCADAVAPAVAAAMKLAEDGGFKMTAYDGKNVWVPNMMGTFSVNAAVSEMMADGAVVPGEAEKVLVIGIKGNVSFNAQAAAMSYKQYQKKLGGKADYYSTVIKLNGWGDRRKISDGELADYLDTEDGIRELTEAILTFCRNNRYNFDKMLLPPALGFINYSKNLKTLKEACGCKIAEIECLGNAVVGYRMTRAMYKALRAEGVKLIRGSVAKALKADDNGVSVEAVVGLTDQLHPGKTMTFTADKAILATGGFLGGGIVARHTKVWINLLEEELGLVTPEMLDRNPVAGAGQDVLRLGASVNSDMTVVNGGFAGRVYACGELLAGQNTASERSGSGVAAATAYTAAVNAAKN